MRIVNETGWRTADLRAIAARVAATELDPEAARRVTIRFVTGRRRGWLAATSVRGSSGYATLGGTRATIRIDPVAPDRVDLAHVIGHEMAHLRGMTHRRMRGAVRYDGRRLPGYRAFVEWAADMPLDRTPARPARPRPDPAAVAARRRTDALEHAAAMVRAWTTRHRRATTILAGWRRRHAARLRAADRAAIGTPI